MKILLLLSFFLLLFSCTNSSKDIVAEVDGEKILLSDLSQATKQEIFDLLNMAHDIKLKALDNLIKQRLLEKEAENRKLPFEQYLEEYLNQKINLNEDSLRRLYGLTEDQVSYAKNEMYASSKANMEGELSLKNKLRSILIQKLADSLYNEAKIKKYIYPPKQPECVIEDLCVHYRGNLKSSVSFIVASDFNCERCVEFEKTLKRIYAKYQDRVKFGFISFAGSPDLAALACEAAAKQNKFWEFHDTIFAHKGIADSTFIVGFAKSAGLNTDQFKQDLTSPENYDKIDQTINNLLKRGVFATPTIIINDRLVYMTNSYEELSRLLDSEL